LTIFDNVVYLTKGSGSNGVNTVSEGFAFASAFEGDAQPCRGALVPGGLDQQPTGVRSLEPDPCDADV
jgi:hypothetical protein